MGAVREDGGNTSVQAFAQRIVTFSDTGTNTVFFRTVSP